MDLNGIKDLGVSKLARYGNKLRPLDELKEVREEEEEGRLGYPGQVPHNSIHEDHRS